MKLFCILATLAIASCGTVLDVTNTIEPKFQKHFDEFAALCIKYGQPCLVKHVSITEVQTIGDLEGVSGEKILGVTKHEWDGPILRTIIKIRSTKASTGKPLTPSELKWIVFHELMHGTLFRVHKKSTEHLMSECLPDGVETGIDAMVAKAFTERF